MLVFIFIYFRCRAAGVLHSLLYGDCHCAPHHAWTCSPYWLVKTVSNVTIVGVHLNNSWKRPAVIQIIDRQDGSWFWVIALTGELLVEAPLVTYL